jgi:hypothetical protein
VRARRIAHAIAMGVMVACSAATLPGYRGPRSDHFDGHHFFNEEPFEEQSPSELARWQLARHRGAWPDSGAVPSVAPPARVGAGELRVTMVNHATVLLQLDSLNILTDPVWSDRVGLEGEVGVRRHRAPGIAFDSLPHIDVVLVSHDHYDHMDLPTLLRLQARDHPRIVTGLGNPAYLATQGVRGAEGLDWWHSAVLGRGVRVTAVPARHARYGVFCGRHGLGADVRRAARAMEPLRARAAAHRSLSATVVHGAQASESGRRGPRRADHSQRDDDPDSLGDVRAG